MKRLISILSLGVALAVPFAASAQTAPGAPNSPAMTPSPDQVAKMAQIRADNRTAAMKAVSPAHVVAVQAIVDQLNAGKIDQRAASTQIDGVLTPDETASVIAIGTKMRSDMAALTTPVNANQATPAPSEQRGEGVNRRRPVTAGGVLLGLMLTPAQMNALRGQPAPRAT